MAQSPEELAQVLYEMLKPHYISLYIEERFYKRLREALRRFDKKGWSSVVWAEKSESARIGFVKALIIDIHRVVHGDFTIPSTNVVGRLDFITTWHGHGKEWVSETLSTGIDLIYLIEYPRNARNGGSVIVPLFIVTKSDLDKMRNEVKVSDIVNQRLKDFDRHSSGKDEKVRIALENIPRFVRGIITETVFGVSDLRDDRWSRIYKRIEEKGECLVADDIVGNQLNLRTYCDIICGALNLVLRDIPEIYNIVANDRKLASLSLADWIAAILYISRELVSSTTPSSCSRPPRQNIEYVVNKVVRDLYAEIASNQEKLSSILQKANQGDYRCYDKLRNCIKAQDLIAHKI